MAGYILKESTQQKTPKEISSWNSVLNTLDQNPNMPDSEVMKLFSKTLASGEKSDWHDSSDNTLLMHMAARGKTAIVKRLIHEFYANVRAVNKDGMTALHMAARGGYLDTCQELNNSGANPCTKNKNGDTPAKMARENGHEDVAQFLHLEEANRGLWGLQSKLSAQRR